MAGFTSGPALRVALSFDSTRPDAALDPVAALDDVLGLLARLQPDTIVFTQLVDQQRIAVEMAIGFDDAAKAVVARQALVMAEGDAGFRATFDPPPSLVPDEWAVAEVAVTVPFGDAPLPLPVPLALAQAKIGRQIRLSGAAYGYRVVARRRPAGPDVARQLVRPLALAERRGPLAAPLVDALRAMVALAAAGGMAVREGICLRCDASDVVAAAVENGLIVAARDVYPFLAGEACDVEWHDLAASAEPGDAVGSLRARDYPAEVMVAVLQAGSRQAWTPPRGGSRGGATPGPPPPPPSPMPGETFAFLSYAHRDVGWVTGVIALLREHKVRLWYDADIDGGDRWDETLERQIRCCGLFIPLLSPHYDMSRYCRREMKFADLIDKPILPVAASGYSWGEGLAMMFQERQITTWTEAGLQALVGHVGRLSPACLG